MYLWVDVSSGLLFGQCGMLPLSSVFGLRWMGVVSGMVSSWWMQCFCGFLASWWLSIRGYVGIVVDSLVSIGVKVLDGSGFGIKQSTVLDLVSLAVGLLFGLISGLVHVFGGYEFMS